MEIRSLMENIVTENFNRDGETFELKFNVDVITPEYYDALALRLAPLTERLKSLQAELAAAEETDGKPETKPKRRAKQHGKPDMKPETGYGLLIEKKIAEIRREAFAERLTVSVTLPDGSHTQLLKDWSITENGIPIPPSKENLMRLPPRAVEVFWERSTRRMGHLAQESTSPASRLDNMIEVAAKGMAAIKKR